MSRNIRIKEVMEITGISRSSIYAKMVQGEFPRQFNVGIKSVAWDYDEIQQWREQGMRVRKSLRDK